MHRILLISDTHGNLDIINQMVAQTHADMVIHAGDFGFYDEGSISRLTPRELRLLVTHSTVWRQYNVDKQTKRETLIEIVKTHQLLGDFPDYDVIPGKKCVHFDALSMNVVWRKFYVTKSGYCITQYTKTATCGL